MISVDGISADDFAGAGLSRLLRLPQHDLLTLAGDWLGELAPWRNTETLAAISTTLSAEAQLAALFIFGEPVAEAEARDRLPGPLLDLLLRTGALAADSGKLSARYCLVRGDGMSLLAAWRAAGRDVGGYAPWVGTDSMTLSRLVAARRDVRTALDLGCGTGILGLSAARNGADVVSVDVNPECTAAATVNAHINGLGERLTAVEGDIMSLDLDRRFDLVISNPPCLPLRRGSLGWLAGEAGLDGLEFFWELLRRVPGLLTGEGEALLQAAAYGDERGPFFVEELEAELRRLKVSGRLLLRPSTPPRWPAFAPRDEEGQLTGPLGDEVREYVNRIGATHYYGFVLSVRAGEGLDVGRFS
ncbi:methyltransferase [Streptomyces pactum]|uniref:Methyltransferase n=1 Tax=Streptomyces pactum TaxID=68249 RepID=A8R0I9_9ACTN|nr:methyltransferase [Streptomyces pactum]ACJ24862.1 HemK family methyltransferase [Streptomyces pactum]MBH5336228.1 methyltransferase [Streptomyces pactum]BAF92588.1 methyltransferase [Streptomyces pactum]